MAAKKIKDIFHFQKEEMSRTVKWFFALPFAFTIFIVLSLIIPTFGDGFYAATIKNILLQSALLLSFVLVITKFLKVPFARIMSDLGTFNLKKFLIGFCFMFVFGVALIFIQMAFNPSDFVFSLKGNPLGEWLITLLFIIIAALTEEIVFRFYIGHFVSETYCTSAKSQLICCLVSGLLFSLAHLSNPEIKSAMFVSLAFYFIFGCALMYCTLKTKGIEYSTGIHVANNLIVGWLFSYPDSVLTTNTLFTQTSKLGAWTIIEVIIPAIVYCYAVGKISCLKD